MFKLIVPIILIAVAVGLFVTFTNPLYREVVLLREGAKSYDEALDNSKALENERDMLTQKYNTIDPGNLAKLEKLLPENVDNIRLILEIEKIALPYGMGLRGGAAPVEPTNRNYGTWTLEFSTSGTYGNFLSFVRDLERNLRVVDISSIAFSSNISPAGPFSEIYQYRFKIKTYWLKN